MFSGSDLVKSQDTVEELGAMGTNAVDDFDWLVQLRYYIEDFGFWELDGCWLLGDFWSAF